MSKKTTIIIITAIVIVAAALRVPGMFTDFWLDEVWSLNIAKTIHSPLDVVLSSSARIDNNHPLHTWYLRAIGDVQQWWIYRLPALACGIGAVIVAAHTMWRRSAIEAIAVALLVGLSFPLVFYSSEARGYAPAVFFALVAFDAMLRYVERPRWSGAIVFSVACVLGFLAHLTFVHFYLAALYWTVLRARRTKLPLMQQLTWWARLNAVPLIFVIVLFRVFVRDMTIGGASETDPMQVLIRTLSIALGGFDFGIGAIICATITVALFIGALIKLIRLRDDLWFFYLLAVVVAPGFLLIYNLVLSARPQPLMPRYFLVAIAMLLPAISHLASSVDRRVVLAALMVIFAANVARTVRFLRVGRDGSVRAIEQLLRESPGPVITVSTESTFWARPVIDFYQSRIVPDGRRIELRDVATPSDWKLTMTPSRELSGFVWQLQRTTDPTTQP
ncbi:MAG: glycosyltransferase family 39 protein [Anaerolineae bacterium]|nr:glycosyltransferase family 39 protein [Phycisphaerae bacterium]